MSETITKSAGTMGFEPTAVGLEVRRSIQTELRALIVSFSVSHHKGLGFHPSEAVTPEHSP